MHAVRVSPLMAALAAAVLTAVSAGAVAADYPNRPIRLILGYTPGGAADRQWPT